MLIPVSFLHFTPLQCISLYRAGRIVRKDMFRGFNAEQQRRIIQENEILLSQRRAAHEAEKGRENQWYMQQVLTSQAMEHANLAEKRLQQEETQHNLEVIKQQMAMQQQKREMNAKSRFGSIEPGFFNKFGSSCR